LKTFFFLDKGIVERDNHDIKKKFREKKRERKKERKEKKTWSIEVSP
jgi:hypothetical protein